MTERRKNNRQILPHGNSKEPSACYTLQTIDETREHIRALRKSSYFVGRCLVSDRIPTFADICSAIAEGSLVATLDGTMYQINALELRRYLNKFRSLPTVATVLAQVSSSHRDSSNWSDSTQTSVA
jgi:hypothetical protein